MLNENDQLLKVMIADGVIPAEAIADQKLIIMNHLDGIDLKKAHEMFMDKHKRILEM